MAEKKEQSMNEMVYIQTRLNAPKNQRNSFGNYNYRSCEDILEALKPLLKEKNCTLTISDDIVQVADRIYVKATATLTTPTGQSFSTTAFAREAISKKGMDDSQVTGATSSYARKYALNGLFCIDDNKDADALNINKEYTQAAPPPAQSGQKPANNNKDLFDNNDLEEAFMLIKQNIETAPSKQYLQDLYNQNPGLHDYAPFKAALNKRYKEVA